MKTRNILLLLTALPLAIEATAQQAAPLYDEELYASRGTREEQWRQMDVFISALPGAANFESPAAFEKSIAPARKRLAAAQGYPPPVFSTTGKPAARMEKAGEDETATYYRLWVPVAKNLETYGLYIVPKSLKGRAPLVVSLHGGGGYPELAIFRGGANYHDMIRGPVAQGWVVFAPLLINYPYGDRDKGTPIPADARQKLSEELMWRGVTLAAFEAAKISRALDAILARPEVDPTRVAMVGLSLGGSQTLITSVLDPRIKAMVISGSPAADNAWLLCPRPVQFQWGENDTILGKNMVDRQKAAAERLGKLYEKLAIKDRFEIRMFDGGHDFRGDLAWPFLKRWLEP